MTEESPRQQLEMFARKLMQELSIENNAVGVDTYPDDIVSLVARKELHLRLMQDMRHLSINELAKIIGFAHFEDFDYEDQQESGVSWTDLHHGSVYCTPAHVHRRSNWLEAFDGKSSPKRILLFMASTLVTATMYDIVVGRRGRHRRQSVSQEVTTEAPVPA